jgi:hypothetical protein
MLAFLRKKSYQQRLSLGVRKVMGIFGLFGKSAPSEKSIANQVQKAKEQYAKPEYRRVAMDKLLEWNTKESLSGLLGRFSVVVQSPHWDEEEKRWLVEEFVKRGDAVKDVLIEFLMKANEVTYVIRCLEKLCTREEMQTILVDALKKRIPDDYRTHQSKMELIAAFEEYPVPELTEVLLPYLQDHNDDVKCMTIDVLTKTGDRRAHSEIAKMLFEEFHSGRVLRQAAQAIFKLQVDLPNDLALAKEVAEDFVLKNGKLARPE